MSLLEKAISPTEAVDRLASKGVHISERLLRKRARELGACRVLGKAMLLLPEHLDKIIAEPDPCHPSSNAETFGGIPSPLTGSASVDLRKRLTGGSPKTSRQKTNGGIVTPLFTGRNRS